MPKATNTKLLKAQAYPDDEFYTPRAMIEAELQHYDPRLFKGKRILCNCDDPGESNGDRYMSAFFEYFDDNFVSLGLRQLVGIRYSGSALWQDIRGAAAYTRTLTANKNGKKHGTRKRNLRGDTGGFDDREGLAQLRACDIVVTNPPFSRWRSFISLLMKSKKKFIIIGNINAVGYRAIFPLIQDGHIWLGAGPRTKGEFILPDGKTAPAASYWYTNLPHHRRERGKIRLESKYSAKDYPRYDNYPAIEVRRVKDIPYDYGGEMGVPRSFIEKHNPRQFEIVGKMRFPRPGWDRVPELCVRGRPVADRLLIKHAGVAADWKVTKDLTRKSQFAGAGGFLYVAVVSGERGWFKVGKTTTSVAERVKRDAFSIKKPKVVMALEVADAGMAEHQVHTALAEYRKKGTEWFNPPRNLLERVLSRLAKKPVRLWQ